MTSLPPDASIAPYVHREVTLVFGGRRLVFATSLDLFSSHQVDVGSQLLLRTLEPLLTARSAEAAVLDIGCGYGALGVALSALPGVRSAHLVDRDALAVDFARTNAASNGLADRVTAAAGLGLDEVLRENPATRYDLVVSNVPGRAGAPVIEAMLLDPLGVLAAGGLVAVVVIEPIRDLVAAALDRPDVEVMLHRDTADYSVFHYRPATGATFRPPDAAFETGVYDAAILELSDALDRQPSITTVHGLPGYDRLGVIDEALLERLPTATPGATVLVTHPGQGALAAGILMRQPQAWFQLVDRDLLALRTTRRALLALGATEARVQTHAVGTWHAQALPAAADLVVGALHEGAGTAAVAAEYRGLVRAIAPGGRALLASSSTAATRLLDVTLPAGLKVTRTRHRGTSFLQLARSA